MHLKRDLAAFGGSDCGGAHLGRIALAGMRRKTMQRTHSVSIWTSTLEQLLLLAFVLLLI